MFDLYVPVLTKKVLQRRPHGRGIEIRPINAFPFSRELPIVPQVQDRWITLDEAVIFL